MRLLQRLRVDLTSGRNLKVYITAAIALVVGALGVLDVAGTRTIAAATLATLALLAVGGPRQPTPGHRPGGIGAQPGRDRQRTARREVTAGKFPTTAKARLEGRLTAADDIRLVGVTLSRTIRNHIGDLERRFLNGARIKVAIIDPHSTTPRMPRRAAPSPRPGDLRPPFQAHDRSVQAPCRNTRRHRQS